MTTRILIVLRDFGMGGAQRQAALIANGLNALPDYCVEVWAFEAGRAVAKLLNPDIITRVLHPGAGRNPIRRIWTLGRFTRALKKARPDVLLPLTDFPNRVVGAAWPLTGARACIWNQRDEGREVTGRPLEKLAIRHCSWFIANSEAGKDHLMKTFGVSATRISIIHNGVAPLTGTSSRSTARRNLGIGNHLPVATMVANLHRFKDHETLLHAWALVTNDLGSQPQLLLAGRPGNTHSRIVELRSRLGLERSVRLLGEVQDVEKVLSATDVAVFSSRREGCPNAVLEAMAAGLPVVATNIIGTREALGADYPYLVDQSDPQSFARATHELLVNPALRQELGERNQKRILEQFSPETAIDAYASLLSSLLG